MNLTVYRRLPMDIDIVPSFLIGDKIEIGKYTATCQKSNKKTAVFMMDQALDDRLQMGPVYGYYEYEESELRHYLNEFIEDPIFNSIRNYMLPFKSGDFLRIPSMEEIFGEINNKKQWLLMKNWKNRKALTCYETEEMYMCGHVWLQNKVVNTTDFLNWFAAINGTGNMGKDAADSRNLVIAVFKLLQPKEYRKELK